MDNSANQEPPHWLLAALGAAMIVLAIVGAWFYRAQEAHYRREVLGILAATGRLKVEQITNWRRERLADAAVLTENPFLTARIVDFLADPNDQTAKGIRTLFSSVKKNYHYADVLLVDPQGQVRLSLHGARGMIHKEALPLLADALTHRRAVFDELHTGALDQMPHTSIIAPVLSGQGQERHPVGAVFLFSDAAQFLYPLIQSWPTPSRTAETLLVSRADGEVLFLNDLRHQSGAALKLRIPLSRTDVPAVMAVQGREGVVEGLDYRGVPVLADIRPIPNSPYYMVAKVDAEEVFAPWRLRATLILLLFLTMAAGFGGLGLIAWQRSQKSYYRSLYQAESQLRASLQRQSVTLHAIGDAVIAADTEGRVELVNPVAAALTGWTGTEACGRPLEEIFRIVNEETREKVESPVVTVLRKGRRVELANHTLLLARDGREIPIADSGAPIRNDQGEITGVVLVFRDQSEERLNRRTVETRLALIEYAARHTLDELLSRALDEVGAFVESPIGFFHFVEPDQKTLSLQQWSSRTLEEFCQAEGRGLHYSIDQAGVWVDCVRQKKPVIHNDYATLPHRKGLPEGHAPVIRELVVPVLREERVVAILGVGNKPTNYTLRDAEIVSYLADIIWEIVRQKRAEEGLRQSEETYRALVTELPDAVARFDRSGRHLFASDRIEQVLALPAAQVIGKSHRELGLAEAQCRFWEKAVQRVFDSGEPFETEHVDEGKHGSTILNVRFIPESGGQGGVRSVLSVSRDITEHRRLEQDYQTLFREMLDGFALHEIICDAQGRPADYRFLAVNPAFERLTGLRAEDLLARTVRQVLPGTESYWIEVYGKVALTGEPLFFENYAQDLGKHFEVKAYRPAPKQFACIFTDITERKRTEAALHEATLLQREAVRAANVGLWNWNLATDTVSYSAEWKRQIGYAEDEIADNFEEWQSRVHPDDLEPTRQRVQQAIEEKQQNYQVEFRFRHKDGSYRWILAQGSVLQDETGRPVRMLGSHVDITASKQAEEERVRLENQFRQAQKMESIGRLAGGVAHDYNNMLSVITSYTEMALDEVSPSEPLHEDLQEVLKAARRSTEITRQLLAFARKQTISPKVLDLNETVEGMLKMLRRLIGEDIDLVWHPRAGLWSVKIDPTQLDQTLANLCVNARDAIAGVGKVTIETGNVTFDEAYCADHPGFVPGEFVLLAVSDNGCGMSKETADNIFEPFFTTKGMHQGTGLGLATVYGIVKQNNGFINVYSEPGKGTTFKLYLPRHESRAAEVQQEETPAVLLGNGETVLLVEDEPAIMRMGEKMLTKLGYQVLAANTPSEAIRLAEADTGGIALLITDVVMPEMNGRQLAERLLAIHPALKCLFMSGYTANVIAHHGVLDEGVNFIQKPFASRDLAARVKEALAQD